MAKPFFYSTSTRICIDPPKNFMRGPPVCSVKTFLDIWTIFTENFTTEALFTDKFPEIKKYTQAYLLDQNGKPLKDQPKQTKPLLIAPDFPDKLIPRGIDGSQTKDTPTTLEIPIITYEITSMVPGNVGGSKQHGSRPIKNKPFYMASITFPDGSSAAEIELRHMDSIVDFHIWASTNDLVDRLAEWFQFDYMETIIPYFENVIGMERIFFAKRKISEYTYTKSNQLGMHGRTLTYKLRTQHLRMKKYQTIKEIAIYINQKLHTTLI